MNHDSNATSIYSEIKVNGKWYKRRFVSFGGESLKKRCGECGIVIGPDHFHHYGCNNEECPECYRRIYSCVCDKSALRKENGEEIEISKWLYQNWRLAFSTTDNFERSSEFTLWSKAVLLKIQFFLSIQMSYIG